MKRAFFLLTCLWVMFGKLAIYPNPAQESLAIDGIDEGDVIDVFNVEGRLVRKETAGFDRIIDVRGLPKGLYWVQCGRKGVPFVKE